MPREVIEPALAGALRALREARGDTQEDIAYRAGVTVGSLARIERGDSNPSWSTVCNIADALGLTLVELARAVERQR